MADPYSAVVENFRRLEEFGWFLPGEVYTNVPLMTNSGGSYTKAAVLFLISHHSGELHVLITKRSQTVRIHKGENCLPGGHQDGVEETPVETALREAQEEVQLDPSVVQVVAVLPPFRGGWTEFIAVTPVVCTLKVKPEDITFVPNDEVEYAYWVPLRVFLDGKKHSIVKAILDSRRLTSHSFDYEEADGGQRNNVIWGLTASVCIVASAIALDRFPDFPFTSNLLQRIDVDQKTLALQEVALTSQQAKMYSYRQRPDGQTKLPTAKL